MVITCMLSHIPQQNTQNPPFVQKGSVCILTFGPFPKLSPLSLLPVSPPRNGEASVLTLAILFVPTPVPIRLATLITWRMKWNPNFGAGSLLSWPTV